MLYKKLLSILLFLISFGNPSCYSNNHSMTSEENHMTTDIDVESVLQEYIENNNGIGAAVAFIENGKIQFYTYGEKSLKDNKPISKNTIFQIGSITKVLTTLVLMDMVENKQLNLDDPIEKYLPNISVPEYEGKKITLRHLATHHSGLPCIPQNFQPKNPKNPYVGYSTQDIYDFLGKYKLEKAPGDQFEYSNYGMGLLGHILSLQSKKSYEQLITDSICKKLDMKNTKLFLGKDDDFANGYLDKKQVDLWIIDSLAGCGGLHSNISDMAKFLSVNMGLKDSSLSSLLKKCQKKQCSLGPACGIGLGWIITSTDSGDIIWHNGGTGGFRSFLGFNNQTKKGVVVLANSGEPWLDSFAMHLLDPKKYPKPSIDKTLAKDIDYLKLFEGSYTYIAKVDEYKFDLSIKLNNSKLFYTCAQGEIELLPESYGVFSFKNIPGQTLQFLFDKDKKIIKANSVLADKSVDGEIISKPPL